MSTKETYETAMDSLLGSSRLSIERTCQLGEAIRAHVAALEEEIKSLELQGCRLKQLITTLKLDMSAQEVVTKRLKEQLAAVKAERNKFSDDLTEAAWANERLAKERDDLRSRIESAPKVALKWGGDRYSDIVDECPENEPYVVVHAVPVEETKQEDHEQR